MIICRTIEEMRAQTRDARAAAARVGLVTTMGALHEGHMALIAAARAETDRVIATIFVNPTQFGDARDLDTYPRDEARDLAMLKAAGTHAVLLPTVEAIYPPGDQTTVTVEPLSNVLHGKLRPGHFRGVTTVVARLFNICQPDIAFFGEKDYQQLQIIKRMATDLHMPLEVRGVPTVREASGLAMSSRNARLSPEDREAAAVISKALDAAEAMATSRATIPDIDRVIRSTINREPRASLRAVDIVIPETLEPAEGRMTKPVAIMISAEFGGVLLIDQRELGP